jgi:hypothetical protein
LVFPKRGGNARVVRVRTVKARPVRPVYLSAVVGPRRRVGKP